jgi:hypothetical protein
MKIGRGIHIFIMVVSLILGIHSLSIVCAEEDNKKSVNEDNFNIDVSGYPEKIQEFYKVFSQKCSKCHDLEISIEVDISPDEWDDFVKRMRRKPGSGITSADEKKIKEFLKYYTEEKIKARDGTSEENKKETSEIETKSKTKVDDP